MEGSEKSSSSIMDKAKDCVACGKPVPWDVDVCPHCGHNFRGEEAEPGTYLRTMTPVIGGILIMVAGMMALIMGVLYFTVDVGDLGDIWAVPPGISAEDYIDYIYVCGALFSIFGVIAMLGGYFGAKRQHLGLAVLGGIMGMLGMGFIIGALMSLVGVFMIGVSRDEFKK